MVGKAIPNTSMFPDASEIRKTDGPIGSIFNCHQTSALPIIAELTDDGAETTLAEDW